MYKVFEKRVGHITGVPYTFVCDPDPNYHPTWWCFTDEDVVRQQWWTVKEGEVVVDAGAAFGSYTLPALALGAERVYAWSPENMDEILNINLDANGWRSRCMVFTTGLWNASGFLKCPSQEMPRLHPTPEAAEADPTPGAIFPVKSLDEELPPDSLKRLDWIKIDVEGAEVEVLEGASNLIKKFKPKLYVENHLFKDPSIKHRCQALIDSLDVGYIEVGTIPYHAVSHSLYAPR